MDGFRDRFGSRYDRNSGRSSAGSSSRNNPERERGGGGMDRSYDNEYDYGGRNDYQGNDDYGSRRSSKGPAKMSQMDQGGGGMNGRQLDIIRDYFDETKDDNKEILHAVDNNAKMLDRGLDILGELKDKADRPVTAPAQDFSGPIASFQELSKKNKEDIINAIAGNSDLLGLLKEQIAKNAEAIAGISSSNGDDAQNAIDKEELEKYFTDLQDHVHKENVKCYRNVAGALEEQDKKNEKKLGNISVVMIFSIIQLSLTIVNIVLLALYIFRVI